MILKQKTRTLILIATTVLIIILMFIFIPKEKSDIYTAQEVWNNKKILMGKQITVKGALDYDDSNIKCTESTSPSCSAMLGLTINENKLLIIKSSPDKKRIGCEGGIRPVCYPPEKEEYILKGTLKKQNSRYYFYVDNFQALDSADKVSSNNENKEKEPCPITDTKETSKCYAELAVEENDNSICEKLPQTIRSWGRFCYIELAVMENDERICEELKNIEGWGSQSIINQCKSMVNKGEVRSLMIEDPVIDDLNKENDVYTAQEIWSQKDYFLDKKITVKGTVDYDASEIQCTTGIPPSCGVNLGIKINESNLLRIKNAPGEKNIGCKGSKPVCYPTEKEEYILNGTLKKVYSSYYFEVDSFKN